MQRVGLLTMQAAWAAYASVVSVCAWFSFAGEAHAMNVDTELPPRDDMTSIVSLGKGGASAMRQARRRFLLTPHLELR